MRSKMEIHTLSVERDRLSKDNLILQEKSAELQYFIKSNEEVIQKLEGLNQQLEKNYANVMEVVEQTKNENLETTKKEKQATE